MVFQSLEIKRHLFPLIDPEKKAKLRNGEDRDGREKEQEGLESGRNPHTRLQVGVGQFLSIKIQFWGILFPCLCCTVELGICGFKLSPKDVIQLAEGENEGKSHQA